MSVRRDDSIRIARYEPWMEDGLLDLFCREYRTQREAQRAAIARFYGHPYQRGALRAVALDGQRVVGSQTWCRWPYTLDGRLAAVFQAGASLVDADVRRRGILGRLLAFGDAQRDALGMQLATCMPNETALPAYVRAGFTHLLDLRWLVRPLTGYRCLRGFGSAARALAAFQTIPDPGAAPGEAAPGFAVSRDPDFRAWRAAARARPVATFVHGDVHIELAARRRGPLAELVIGDVSSAAGPRASRASADALRRALADLLPRARAGGFAWVSVALNPQHADAGVRRAFGGAGFRRIPRRIHFAVRDYGLGDAALRPELWRLYRGDADTW